MMPYRSVTLPGPAINARGGSHGSRHVGSLFYGGSGEVGAVRLLDALSSVFQHSAVERVAAIRLTNR